MMRLEVLGSWAGSPGAGGACSGYLLVDGDTKILFDCGPGVVPALQKHGNTQNNLSGKMEFILKF